MRKYEEMSIDQISRALTEYRNMRRAIENYQRYLGGGNGLPKDELRRIQLQFSNSKLADMIGGYILNLEAELSLRAAN